MTIHTETYRGFSIEISQDLNSCHPRKDWEQLETFGTLERHSSSPDATPCDDQREALAQEFDVRAVERDTDGQLLSRDYCNLETDPERIIKEVNRQAIIMPVDKYEHGLVMYKASNSNPFTAHGTAEWLASSL